MQCLDRCHQQRETARAASSQEPPGTVEGRTLSPCTWILPQYAAGFIVRLAFLLNSVILMNNSKESNLEAKLYSYSLPLPLLCRKYEQSRAVK